MSTLADGLIDLPRPEQTEGVPAERIAREVRGWLKGVPVIEINNVAKYFYDVFWEERGSSESAFPGVAPPFWSFWMEYRVPKTISGGGLTAPMPLGGNRVGFYWLATDRPESRGGWILTSLMFAEDDDVPCVLGPVFSVELQSDAQGQLVSLLGRGIVGFVPPEEEAGSFAQDMLTLHDPAVLPLCYMNCSNVRMLDHNPKENHRRRHLRLYGRPPIVYKTLHIAPMQRIITSKGGSDPGLKQALHIMRGHFKKFDIKALFGKHRGMWWWSSQVRGALEHGYVRKAYEVHPPQKDEHEP